MTVRRFLIDVLIAVPAVLVASVVVMASMEGMCYGLMAIDEKRIKR
jgi:hypothetical protein